MGQRVVPYQHVLRTESVDKTAERNVLLSFVHSRDSQRIGIRHARSVELNSRFVPSSSSSF